MDRDSMQQMKYDVRMQRRRGWVTKEEFAKQLAELPDVAAKAAPPEAQPSGEER